MHRSIILPVLAMLCMAGAAAWGGDDRDPFNLPANAENLYRYEEAIQTLSVKGIVRAEGAEGAERVIVSIAGIDGLAVLRQGDRVALNLRGLAHYFEVGEIEVKSVMFHALAGSKDINYEIFVR